MQPRSITPDKNHQRSSPNRPYLSWPSHLELEGLEVADFEKVLRRDPGSGCQVVKYVFDVQNRQWEYQRATGDVDELKNMVTECEKERSYFL